MESEEFSNRPQPGRQPRSRNRMSVDGISSTRADYLSRPAVRPQSMSRPAPVVPITIQTESAPEPASATAPVAPTPVVVVAPEPDPTPTPEPQFDAAPAPVELAAPSEAVEAIEPEAILKTEPAAHILNFTPPSELKKKPRFAKLRSRIKKPRLTVSRRLVAAMAVVLVVGAAGSGVSYVAASQDNDSTLLREALTQALSVTQVHVTSGDQTAADFDFTDQKNPIISGTFSAPIAGQPATIDGYSDIKNSYVSYKTLPASTPVPIAKQAVGSWVQLRTAGVSLPGVPSTLAHAADPHYQLFGPVLFGNLPQQAKKQIVDYIMAHTVYDYEPSKSVKDSVNGQSVRRFDMHVETGDLIVAAQSYATLTGFAPTDVQDAMTALGQYKGTNVSLYISSKSHQIVRFVSSKQGQTTTFDYSNFNKASTSAEPQTKLTWQNFAATQLQLSAQTASKQPAVQLDILRKNQVVELQKAFKAYQAQTGSFPSLSNLNDPTWVAANLPNVNPDSLRDPISTSQAVLAAPKAGSISYQVLNADGKPGCDNTAINPCTQYKLVTTLSTTQQYTVAAP